MCTQDDTLRGTVSSVDVATKKNLSRLVTVGEGLLKQRVSRVNLDSGRFEASDRETNEEALRRYIYIYITQLSKSTCIIYIDIVIN